MIESLFSLEGKTAVVTGASGYLGRSFVECLLSVGCTVIMIGRSTKVREICRGYKNDKLYFIIADSYETESYTRSLKDIVKDGKVDILVNNSFDFSVDTGFNHPSGRLENISKNHKALLQSF